MDGRRRSGVHSVISDLMIKFFLKLIVLLFAAANLLMPGIHEKVDFSMAEKSIEWIKLIRGGSNKAEQEIFFKNNISITSGADSIKKYWRSITEGEIPELNTYFFHLLKKREPGKTWNISVLTRKWYQRSRELLLKVYKKPDFYKNILEKLKKYDIAGEALKLAGECLPDVSLDDIKIEFIFFGHSLAFTVENMCVYDFLQLPVDKKGNIFIDEVIQTLAHEIHHLGFKRISNNKMTGVVNMEKLSLIWMLSSEGIPTFYIDKPFKKINEFKKRKDILYKRIASDWKKHKENLNDLYIEAENDISLALKGGLSLSAINWKWNEGVKGAVYVLGSDMISVIDEFLGKDAVMDVIADYRKLITIYNSAAKAGNRAGREFYVFSDKIGDMISGFIE